jgi:hypothetical protein
MAIKRFGHGVRQGLAEPIDIGLRRLADHDDLLLLGQ